MAGDGHEVDMRSSAAPLYLASRALRKAWMALRVDTSPAAPCAPRAEALSAGEAAQRVLDTAEREMMMKIDGVQDHLRQLVLGYAAAARSVGPWQAEDWPGVACYTTCRAILEGCGQVGWFLNPTIDFDERLRRGARIILWSLSEEQAGPTPPDAALSAALRADIQATGLPVWQRGNKRRPGQTSWGIEVEGRQAGYTHLVGITDLMPDGGRDLYHRWSGFAHQVAWAHQGWGRFRIDRQHHAVRHVFGNHEDRHYPLLINMAAALTEAGRRYHHYLGRSPANLETAYLAVVRHLEEELPKVQAALAEADTRRDEQD
ncbi:MULTISPECIES: hypothetical protein [Actinosynnema]|uniref:hypothetical protein n=1 Tax=Actinosynnema TaxID=40566 RepID=UPI0020A2B162|nr:hypothetical protein [Actinosynnema pretiosum]MCP2099934.1 hypothetical protein [Actinosynnema pretiosum]